MIDYSEILAPVEEFALPNAQTGFENKGHQRLTKAKKSGKTTKEEYPSEDVPKIVYYQSDNVLPTVIPKYVSEAGDDPKVVERPI